MTIGSGDIGSLPRPGTLGDWVKGVVARMTRPKALRGMSRNEFEQIARDFELSPAELYRLLTGRAISGDRLEKQLAALGVSRDRVSAVQVPGAEQVSARAQLLLPIGPSCC